MAKHLFSSESVTKGHPDKMCDCATRFSYCNLHKQPSILVKPYDVVLKTTYSSKRSTDTLRYQLVSKIAILPFSGVFVQKRHKNGYMLSSFVSSLIAKTLNPLGSSG